VTALRDYLRRYLDRPMVRPWALAVPVLVLMIALPLLRPLRHPAEISDEELLRLATIRALVEYHTLAIDKTAPFDSPLLVRAGDRVYADQPPMMSVLLAPPAWVMWKVGLSFESNQSLIAYMLTLIGVTLPVAGAAGLVYRMGRLFELPRRWRTGLAAVTVLGSGLLSYAVVLNVHAPAAVLVLSSAACLIHVASLKEPRRALVWLAIAGLCASFAATLDPAAAVFVLLFLFVIAAMRFPISSRALGVLVFVGGAIGPLVAHDLLNRQITGDILPATLHDELSRGRSAGAAAPAIPGSGGARLVPLDDDELTDHSWLRTADLYAGWTYTSLFGSHGIVSHFPIVLFGVAGVFAVMHRHWPTSTKTLAAASLAGAATVIATYCVWRSDWRRAMFATRWFIVFMPMLVFWCGAWARRKHAPAVWGLAGVLLAFSVVVSIIGATDPFPPGGFNRYTAVGALKRWLDPRASIGSESAFADGLNRAGAGGAVSP
jgi:hypothetical protein